MRSAGKLVSDRRAWTATALGVVVEALVASCAESNVDDDLGAAWEEAAGTTAHGGDAGTGNGDSGCDDDATSCTQLRTCEEAEWCTVETGHDVRKGLFGVWGSGKDDVWVVGGAGSVLHWDGKTWASTTIDSDASVGVTGSLYAVWGTASNDIWAVSSLFEIFHTTGFVGDFAQWSTVPVARLTGDLFYDFFELAARDKLVRTIWGTSARDVWIGGNPCRRRVGSANKWRSVAVDGGTDWTQASNDSLSGPDIHAIWGSGPNDIWAVGSGSWTRASGPIGSSAMHTIGVATDGGVPTWNAFDTQSNVPLNAVWGANPRDVWAVGDYGTIRHFTGSSELWSVVDSPTKENLRGLWGSGSEDVWAVGDHGTLLHYDGAEWRYSTGAFPRTEMPNLYGVWGSGPADVWSVGSGIVMHFSGPKPDAKGANP